MQEVLEFLRRERRPRFIVIPGRLTIRYDQFAKLERELSGMYFYWKEDDEKELKWVLLSPEECAHVENQLTCLSKN